MPRSGKAAPHVPVSLPQSFAASSEQALGSLVAERLQRIFPETDVSEAVLYMEDASLALSLYRSYKGIAASAFKDLVPLFDLTLRGPVSDEKINSLEDALEAEIESASAHLGIERKAQRVKGAFHLLSATALRRRSSPPSTTV
jgi:hypothetical protein